jgi:hypothetical protein
MSEQDQLITDLDGLLSIARELMDGWERFTATSTEFTFGQRNSISVYGVAVHVHTKSHNPPSGCSRTISRLNRFPWFA